MNYDKNQPADHNIQYHKCTGKMKMQTADDNCHFWASSNAFYIYAVLLLSVVLRQCWVLHGVSLVLLLKFWKIGSKWVNYVRADPQYGLFVRFCQGYFRVVMNEYRDLLTGKYGKIRMAMAHLALRYAVYEARAYMMSHGANVKKLIRKQFVHDLKRYIRRSPHG